MKKPKEILIFLVVGLISLFLGYKAQQIISPQTSSNEIVIEMEALPAPPAHQTNAPNNQSVYESHCAACHDTGAANAPKLGDTSAWAPRIAKGRSILLEHVLQGYNLMPPKGGCLECSDADLKAATDYIVFKGPRINTIHYQKIITLCEKHAPLKKS